MSDVLQGSGATVEFGSSGYEGEITEMILPFVQRESIITSHLGSSGAMTFKPGKIYDDGILALRVFHNPGAVNLIVQPEEELIIKYKNTSESETYERQYYGHCEQIGGESFRVGELMVTNIKMKVRRDTPPPGQNTIPGGWVVAITGWSNEFYNDVVRIDAPRELEGFTAGGTIP
jgi:hypothetical protein